MAAEDCSRSFRALEKKTVAKQLRRFVVTLFFPTAEHAR